MNYLIKAALLLAIGAIVSSNVNAHSEGHNDDLAWSYLVPLTVEKYGIGARPAGSDAERKAAKWLTKQWKAQGYTVQSLPFDYRLRGKDYSSQNLVVDIKGNNKGTLIIGAHYDSTGHNHGSLGATDNASGMAALLALSTNLYKKKLPFNVRLVAFGAEEVGIQGAKVYVNDQLKDKKDVIGMINLDTIIGGDNLYVHSAHTKPYECKDIKNVSYNSDVQIRDGLIAISKGLSKSNNHSLHPAYDGYPEGVTGSWSDHFPFACAGIPIAYMEATNFSINGYIGNDGYSQTTSKELWDCFDEKNNTACDRKNEKSWGMIWHTRFDRLDTLEPVMHDRLVKQLQQNVDVLTQFVLTADKYIK